MMPIESTGFIGALTGRDGMYRNGLSTLDSSYSEGLGMILSLILMVVHCDGSLTYCLVPAISGQIQICKQERPD